MVILCTRSYLPEASCAKLSWRSHDADLVQVKTTAPRQYAFGPLFFTTPWPSQLTRPIDTAFDLMPAASNLAKISMSPVRATSPFRLSPAQNMLTRHHHTVLLQAMKADPPSDTKCRDKFLVQTAPITGDKEFTSIGEVVSRHCTLGAKN